MLIPNQVFPISKVCDCEITRYALGGVHLERDAEGPVAVATDGRRMIAVRWVEADGKLYPLGYGDVGHVENFETIIPQKQWDEAGKMPPKRTPKPILANVLLEEPTANGTVRMVATDLETVKQVTPRALEGRFPRWRDVMPKDAEPGAITVSLDATYAAEVFAALAKICTSEESRGVDITVSSAEKAVYITGKCKATGVSATAVIMPMCKQS